jgi:hypothetical protein
METEASGFANAMMGVFSFYDNLEVAMKPFETMLRLALLTSMLVVFWACKKNPVGPQVTPNVQLSADYVTCTEVWLKLGFSDSPSGGDYRITRDGATLMTGTMSGTNVILYDTTALPNKSYSYIAYRVVGGEVKQISPALSVTTLDSTSDNFSWQAFTFGGNAGSCLLKDVAIINDTLAYAVGAIYLMDSTGNADPNAFNLLTWNGRAWTLSRIYYYTFCGQSHMGSYPTNTAFGLSPTDLWIAGAGQVTRWNGMSQSNPQCVILPNGFFIDRLWAKDTNSVYIVGHGGISGWYNGESWQETAVVTSFDIQDIWGTVDAEGSERVLAVACYRFTNDGSAIVQLSGNSAASVQTTGLPSNLSSIWSANGKEWYVCGDGLHQTRSLDSSWQSIAGLPSTYMESMRGNGPNDIFIAGDFGLMLHFNGSTWNDLTQQVNIPNCVFYAVGVKGNTVVAVGSVVTGGVAGGAIIVMGRRN